MVIAVSASREGRVERALIEAVRERGGHCLKLAPLTAGLPDRLCVLPDRPPLWVECKTDRGYLSPMQVHMTTTLRVEGYDVEVVRTEDGARAVVAAWTTT